MSGGYDYVVNKQIYHLVNVPGYATFGSQEPYGINDFDKKIADWIAAAPLRLEVGREAGRARDFQRRTAEGGRLPPGPPAQFIPLPRLRNRRHAASSTPIPAKRASGIASTPGTPTGPSTTRRSIGCESIPLPKDTPAEKISQRIWAENLGDNRIKITSQNARRLRIYLHPKMVDFSKPVEVLANGQTVFDGKVDTGPEDDARVGPRVRRPRPHFLRRR